MSYYEAWLEKEEREAAAEHAEWLKTPEGAALESEHEKVRLVMEREQFRYEREQLEKASARRRQEREWKRQYPTQWRAWKRLRRLLEPSIGFGGVDPFDFDTFRNEVGSPPPGCSRVVRRDRSLPYQQGNLRWGMPRATKSSASRSDTATAPLVGQGIETIAYLTKAEVAERLGVSSRTVNRWVSQGLLKPFRRGQVLRFRREDVEAFEAKGRSVRR